MPCSSSKQHTCSPHYALIKILRLLHRSPNNFDLAFPTFVAPLSPWEIHVASTAVIQQSADGCGIGKPSAWQPRNCSDHSTSCHPPRMDFQWDDLVSQVKKDMYGEKMCPKNMLMLSLAGSKFVDKCGQIDLQKRDLLPTVAASKIRCFLFAPPFPPFECKSLAFKG